VRYCLAANPVECVMFDALRDRGPLTHHELYRVVSKEFGGLDPNYVDGILGDMRDKGDVVRAGLRPPGEHLFKLAD
jgi:hypothetical protein